MYEIEYLINLQESLEPKTYLPKKDTSKTNYPSNQIFELQEYFASKTIPSKGIENLLPETCNLDFVSGDYYPYKPNTNYKDAKPIYKTDSTQKDVGGKKRHTKYRHLSVA